MVINKERVREARRRFTLIELLVCIAVIAILAAMLLPTMARVKERAMQVVCANRLRQNGIAMILYAKENEGYWQPAADARWQHRPQISYLNVAVDPYDMRPDRKRMLGDIDTMLVCPFVADSLPITDATNNKVHTSYEFYAGTYMDKHTDPNSGMLRMGKKTTFNGKAISVIMGDACRVESGSVGGWRSNHPFVGSSLVRYDTSNILVSANMLRDVHTLEGLSLNYVYDDGHVEFFKKVSGYSPTFRLDDRFETVSNCAGDDTGKLHRSWVPFDQ